LLDEMVSLVAEQGLEVVTLEEACRRLVERDVSRRFVAFSFDGAYRSILTSVLPLFEKRAMPFTLFAGSDFLGTGRVPWWLALEALFKSCDRILLQIEGESYAPRWRTLEERQQSFSGIHHRLARMDSAERTELVEAACTVHGVDVRALARREMLSAEELKALQAHGLVTIGSLAGGIQALAEMSFDAARDALVASQSAIEVATGVKPRALAYPGGTMSGIAARDLRIARELGFEIGLTSMEGALWQEHGRELLALPRIELDNNPATLVRALMLGAQSAAPAPNRLAGR
jgi:peptidoglycan/xylan/chitin deacetylase (PgdA/CDA1 family)